VCAEVVKDGKLESCFGKFKLKQDGIKEKLKVGCCMAGGVQLQGMGTVQPSFAQQTLQVRATWLTPMRCVRAQGRSSGTQRA
jgi:hypothetical protein